MRNKDWRLVGKDMSRAFIQALTFEGVKAGGVVYTSHPREFKASFDVAGGRVSLVVLPRVEKVAGAGGAAFRGRVDVVVEWPGANGGRCRYKSTYFAPVGEIEAASVISGPVAQAMKQLRSRGQA